MATSTPWGPSQQATRIVPGLTSYITAGHGGVKVSPTLYAALPQAFRGTEFCRRQGWFEEDCDVLKLAVIFPKAFTAYWHLTPALWADLVATFAHCFPTLMPTLFAHHNVTTFEELVTTLAYTV